jgi:hypothetical protein
MELWEELLWVVTTIWLERQNYAWLSKIELNIELLKREL